MRSTLLIALVLATIACAVPAQAERRVALVVGNGVYQNAGTLANPPRDAAAMAGLLVRVGFEVESIQNAGQRELVQALRRFSRRADGADLAVFFYAGHGIQANDVNYLLPVDASAERVEDLRYDGIDVGSVLAAMQGARARLVFLDACRNNPLADRLASRSRGVSRGLARVETGDVGALVAFATGPGMTADDGDGTNSPFTAALVENLATPGLEVRAALTRVRNQVLAATRDRQVPWENSSLRSEIYFAAPAEPPATAAAPSPGAAAAGALAAPDPVELRFWESAERGNTFAEYQAYLRRYPQGSFVDLARARISGMEEARVRSPAVPAAVVPPAAPAAAPRAALPPAGPPEPSQPPVQSASPSSGAGIGLSLLQSAIIAAAPPVLSPPAAAGAPAATPPPAATAPDAPNPPAVAAVPAARAVDPLDRLMIASRFTVVRGAAGDAAPRIGQLATDSTIRATGRSQIAGQTWFRVAFQGREGWVSSTTTREIDPAEVAAWTAARDSRDAAEIEAFLAAHPRSYYATRARAALQALRNPPAANAPQVASRPPAVSTPAADAGALSGCYRVPRSGGNFVRLCFNGGSSSREESISAQASGYSVSTLPQGTNRDVCRAPLTVADGGGEMRLSWPTATCSTGNSSGGSTLCRRGADAGSLTCGGETYRRE